MNSDIKRLTILLMNTYNKLLINALYFNWAMLILIEVKIYKNMYKFFSFFEYIIYSMLLCYMLILKSKISKNNEEIIILN